jgi:hypothetical protein
LDGVAVGDELEVKFNLGRCREYNGKWYGDMHVAWYIKKIEAARTAPSTPDSNANPLDEDEDDVPF